MSAAPEARTEKRTPPAPHRQNRRSCPRRKPKGKVKVHCYRGIMEIGPDLAVRLLDVSENGVRLLLNAALDRDKDVVLLLEGPLQKRPFRFTGRVVWSVPAEDGSFCTGVRLDKYLRYEDLAYLT